MAGESSGNNAKHAVASKNQDSVADLLECEDCGHLVPAQNMVVHGLRACQPRKRPAHRENNLVEEQEQTSAKMTQLLPDMASFPLAAASAPPVYDADTATALSSEPPHYDDVAVLPPPTALFEPPSYHGVKILSPPSPENLSNVNSNEPPVEHEDDWVVVPRQSPGESMSNTNRNEPMVATDSSYPSTNNLFKKIADAWERWTSCGAGVSHDNENTPPYPARRATEGRQGSNLRSIIISSNSNNHNNTVAAAWTCPQCTLDNATTRQKCEACLFRNPALRAPDAVRRGERLSGRSPSGQHTEQQNANANNAPVDYLSGGAILGGVVGVAGAALMGQNPVVGLLEGAMNGAFTGAVVGSTVHAREQIEEQQRIAASASRGGGGPVRVVRRQMPNGSMMDLSRPGGPVAVRRLSVHDYSLESAMVESLMMSGPADTGSENLGADQAQIQALPSSKIEDPSRLPEDGQECSICLESFRKGTTRKTLPCLHGFHNKCVDQWLRTNASCPICKHSIAS